MGYAADENGKRYKMPLVKDNDVVVSKSQADFLKNWPDFVFKSQACQKKAYIKDLENTLKLMKADEKKAITIFEKFIEKLKVE